jgi:hypothetical protein
VGAHVVPSGSCQRAGALRCLGVRHAYVFDDDGGEILVWVMADQPSAWASMEMEMPSGVPTNPAHKGCGSPHTCSRGVTVSRPVSGTQIATVALPGDLSRNAL